MTDKATNKPTRVNSGNDPYQKYPDYPKKHQQAERTSPNIGALIVDDCASTRLLLGHYAQLRNFIAWSAPSGEAALELAARQSFDLVFMDISMPGIDGVETIRRMAELETFSPQTQFIICSGYTLPDLGPDLAPDQGAKQIDCSFLHKPICRQKFNRLMDRLDIKLPLPALDQFDDTILSGIFDETDDPLKYRICMELSNDISRHVNNMMTADKQQDLTAFERATHALKGVSGTFGAVSLHRLADEGNQMARRANSGEAFRLATKIEASAHLALDNIQRFSVPEQQKTTQSRGHNHE